MDKKIQKRFECNETHIQANKRMINSLRFSRIFFFIVLFVIIYSFYEINDKINSVQEQIPQGEWECIEYDYYLNVTEFSFLNFNDCDYNDNYILIDPNNIIHNVSTNYDFILNIKGEWIVKGINVENYFTDISKKCTKYQYVGYG